ncbi:facilitated trehalose transporter Tret1 [Eurytemora carolleeae]|uniref:facilitated trehalose transporter Tret1 n=1 Tax=Eurytemora carolleeae TaxID=1294199 RepID=UPI000C758CED|nr:facilitated trehalose transporter Tret1 [Eurytemora carolleeae]|eukprot:XP_023342985.1 facilitated trehalose transporter Tret1-like [Eurytemora affinis]
MLGVGGIFGLSYILVLTAVQVSMLYLARVLMGIGLGISTSVSTVYIQDIASPKIRGSLGAIPSVAGALGVFSFQILNAFITWRQLNVLGATLSIPLILALSFLPESPVFLVSRQKLKAAEKALRALRGPNYDVQSELKSLQARQDKSGKSTKSRMSFAVLKDKEVLKRVFISWMLLILLNASGVGLVMSYTVQIFQSVNSSVDEFVATIYVGSALLASNVATVLLAHKLPRRIMMMVSSLGISATLAILGLSYQLQDWEKQCIELGKISAEGCSYGNLGWLPLCTLMIYIFVFNLGIGAMVFITMAEILPPHAREIGMSLCIALSSPTAFLVQYSFPYLLQELKGQGVFWLYSSLSLAGFVFITFMIPETQGKTDQQIQQQMQSNQSDKLNQESTVSIADQKVVQKSTV